MTGKLLGIILVVSGLVAGIAMYYLQVYAFYEDVTQADIRLTTLDGEVSDIVPLTEFRGIDAESSPIRFRACFTTSIALETARATYTPFEDAAPRNAPPWFECFDAEAIAAELAAGTAAAFLGEKNVGYGVDRVVVLTEDGRGFAWHELNDCGQKAYDGTVVGEECPPRPTE